MSNGLGFNQYTSKYLGRIYTAGGTIPGVVNQQVFENLAKDLFSAFGVKPYAVWPFYGGNADSHALDLFGDSLITWTGTITHDSNGITSGGGIGQTAIRPASTVADPTLWSLGVYCRTNNTVEAHDMIASSSGTTIGFNCRNVAGNGVWHSGSSSLVAANSSSAGLFSSNRYAATNFHGFINAITHGSVATSSTSVPTGYIYLMGSPGASTTTRNIAFAFFGASVSEFPPATLYNIIQAYQTALARQV